MPGSVNEIRHPALAFAKEWQGETREEAETGPFWDELEDDGIFERREFTDQNANAWCFCLPCTSSFQSTAQARAGIVHQSVR